MAKAINKIFVIDTNVILHDYLSIFNFQDNDIVIPITVLEELDKFKKGGDLINFHAREFMRELDKLIGDKLFSDGVSLGSERGFLYIETGKDFSEEMKKSFAEVTPDHKILAVAVYLHKTNKNRKVVLVSQDTNLRMKAKSLGVQAQDYQTGKVRDVEYFSKSVPVVENVNESSISRLYKEYDPIPVDDFQLEVPLKPNQYMILKGTNSSALVHYDSKVKVINRVEKIKAYGITPRNSEQTFAFDALMRPDIQLVSLTGKAGTGKTLLALAAALQQRRDFQQIFLARPIVPLANRDMGFLPGDIKEKLDPYMQPLYDNLSVIKHKFNPTSQEYIKIEEMVKQEKLVISPLAYIRGRSLSNVYFIVDEAQNLTPHEIKTIITRAGEGTKMVFTGDIYQIDSPYLDMKSNGLSYLTDRMSGQDVFAHVNLVRGERSPLADLAGDLL